MAKVWLVKHRFNLIWMVMLAGWLLTGCGSNSNATTEGDKKPESQKDSTTVQTTNTTAAAASTAATPAPVNTNTNEVAVIKTAQGEMVIEFWPDVAPKTVENFKKLAAKGFYDGTAFHRIIKGFMIQGGDPLSKTDDPNVGTGGPGYQIKAEFNERSHQRGVLSMARSRNPDSAGSQFFICLGDASFLDRQYTAFGKVIKGDDVLGKLGDSPVADGGQGEKSRPVQRVGVETIKIVPADSVK